MDDSNVIDLPSALDRPVPPQLKAQQAADLARRRAGQDMSPMGYAIGGAALGGVGAMFVGYPGWLGALAGAMVGYGYGRFG